MASAADVITAISKFELDLIEKQWSDDIWSSEFTSCPDDICDEFADKFSPLSYCDIVQVIEQANKVISMWINNCLDTSTNASTNCADSSNSGSALGPSWTLLQDIDYKKLLSVLYFYICKGHINNQDVNSVHACVKATNFYFTLLIIPGSDIYKIFHLTLFEKCLETFSLYKYLEIATGRKIKKTKTKSGEFSSDEEFLEMDETLTLSEQQNVLKHMIVLLTTFQQLVNKFSFKKYSDALNMSFNILAELTRIERSSNVQEFHTDNSNTSFAPLSRKAYMTMKDFCSSLHGRIPEIIRLVLFYLMPNLTSVGGLSNPELNKLNQKELTNIRNIAVSFIIDNIIPMGENAHLGLKILIQQLCYNMIDRADYRSKATEMVLSILCKLPMDLYYVILKWIFRLSMMEGAHHRVIGLELLSKLIFLKQGSDELSKLTESQFLHLGSHLQNSDCVTASQSQIQQKNDYTSSLTSEPIISFTQPKDYVPLEYRRVMFAIIVDRIQDESAIVKTRALSILSDLILNKTSHALQVILRDVFLNPYEDMNSIALQNFENENDFLKWKMFVALLDKVQGTQIGKSMIPGARVILNKMFEKCLEEKVNVRKAALQVISNLFKFSSKWMTNDSLMLFGKHCRDPALSIRREMLNCVTNLMLFFPDHEPLMNLWIEEVVPLIMDREIRVQEHALQIFTQTILSKVTHFDKMRTPSDELPWKLLDRIAKKNKRSFLKIACALWSENGSFNRSLITMLKTHVGTINDGPVWVFLSCISQYFDIENPDFVLSYYMDVVSKETGDKNTSYLALLTLSASWQKLSRDKKEALQMEMYSKLKLFSVDVTFVGLVVEIVAGITVYIAEDEQTGKKEVDKWGMEMIRDCEAHLENCLRAEKEKKECKDCINILALLGTLFGICPDKISHPTFSILYNYLMNSKNGGSSFDRKLCATIVITLSKMALQSDLCARSLVAGLAQLLSYSSDPILLNNVIVAIADIGESYANLIEPLIPSICVCLKSKNKSLKEITLILLIELLQEDYLKARGAIIFHLLTMINESNSWLVNIVKYYFTNSLIARNPYKMYELLLPALFHFNNYTNHPDYPRLEMTEAEWEAFDISGPENHSLRMNIYQFMLSNVPDMFKMKCSHFICTVVLNGAADNIITIKSKDGEQLLFDALSVLLTKEIKIEYNDLVNEKNEDGEDEDAQKQNPWYKLGKQIFTAAQKKEIIETIVPICCKLKKKLLVENKRLLPYLHKFVRELVKDYKEEINEIFKTDKQFGVEIMHELDKIVEEDAEEDIDEDKLAAILVAENAVSEKTTAEEVIITEKNDGSAKENEITDKTSKVRHTLPIMPEKNCENVIEKRRLSLPSNIPSKTSEVRVQLEKLNLNKESALGTSSRKRTASPQSLTDPSKKLVTKEVLEGQQEEPFSANSKRELVGSTDKLELEKRINVGEREKGEKEIEGPKNLCQKEKSPSEQLGLKRLEGLESNKSTQKNNDKPKINVRRLSVVLERLDDKVLGNLRKNQEEEKIMENAISNIVMPPPSKSDTKKSKKYSLTTSKNFCNKTPTTPILAEKKELLTSTPLVMVGNTDFAMDISSVVDDETV